MGAFGVEVPLSNMLVLSGEPSKHEALDALIDAVSASPAILDREAFRQAIHDRESVMSTGIGGGIAIPHVRIPEVKFATLGVGVFPDGIEFNTLDNSPVYIMILFATPEGADKEYLGMLARVMAALKNRDLFDRMISCHNPEELAFVVNS